jgi:hypothetical protein
MSLFDQAVSIAIVMTSIPLSPSMAEMMAIASVESDCTKNKGALLAASGARGLPGRPLSKLGAHQNATACSGLKGRKAV